MASRECLLFLLPPLLVPCLVFTLGPNSIEALTVPSLMMMIFFSLEVENTVWLLFLWPCMSLGFLGGFCYILGNNFNSIPYVCGLAVVESGLLVLLVLWPTRRLVHRLPNRRHFPALVFPILLVALFFKIDFLSPYATWSNFGYVAGEDYAVFRSVVSLAGLSGINFLVGWMASVATLLLREAIMSMQKAEPPIIPSSGSSASSFSLLSEVDYKEIQPEINVGKQNIVLSYASLGPIAVVMVVLFVVLVHGSARSLNAYGQFFQKDIIEWHQDYIRAACMIGSGSPWYVGMEDLKHLLNSAGHGTGRVTPVFTRLEGIISDKENILLVETMTVPEAKLKCLTLKGCKGFTFYGADTTDNVSITFASAADGIPNDSWTTYLWDGNGMPGLNLVLMSEGALRVQESQEQEMLKAFQSVARFHSLTLGLSYALIPENGTWNKYNTKHLLTLILQNGSVGFKYQQYNTVPNNEDGVEPGSGPAQVVDTAPMVDGAPIGRGLGKIGGAICFDYDFPSYIRKASAGADLMLGPSWDWGTMAELHASHFAFRSAENGFTLFRCASGSLSGVWDPYGRKVFQRLTKYSFSDSFIVDLPKVPRVFTLYSIIGDAFGWLNMGFAFIILVMAILPEGLFNKLLRRKSLGAKTLKLTGRLEKSACCMPIEDDHHPNPRNAAELIDERTPAALGGV